jgi:hypothetical protein
MLSNAFWLQPSSPRLMQGFCPSNKRVARSIIWSNRSRLLDIPLPQERAPTLAPDELRRRQLAALTAMVMASARVQPVVLAIEDLHWADPTTLNVLRGIAERGALAPLFIVATTRPEFRPPWDMRSHHATISLAPLDRAQVRDMIAELSARHALPREVVDHVAARTGGVPLFVEEVTRLLLERGEKGGVHAIPPSLQQSLMARLDRLGPAREVAHVGSVIGHGFSFGLLRTLAGMEDAVLQAALERLADADILHVQGFPPDANYRFKHALIQDAAYENLLKSRRQVLHRRVAEILLDRFPDTAAAEPEVLAHHFARAGLTDAAIEWWGKAATRRCAVQPSRRRSRISARPSRWQTKPARVRLSPRPHPLRPTNSSNYKQTLARRLCIPEVSAPRNRRPPSSAPENLPRRSITRPSDSLFTTACMSATCCAASTGWRERLPRHFCARLNAEHGRRSVGLAAAYWDQRASGRVISSRRSRI